MEFLNFVIPYGWREHLHKTKICRLLTGSRKAETGCTYFAVFPIDFQWKTFESLSRSSPPHFGFVVMFAPAARHHKI